MIKKNISNVNKIRLACHKVLGNTEILPKNGETYCNIGFWLMMKLLGHSIPFTNQAQNSPLLANEIIDILEKNYKKIDMDYCLNNVLSGNIFVCGLKAKEHGHIAVIYPMISPVISKKFKKEVPLVANIGKTNGIMGMNWAFREMPNFYEIGVPVI